MDNRDRDEQGKSGASRAQERLRRLVNPHGGSENSTVSNLEPPPTEIESSPFLINTSKTYVARCGRRNGYVTLAPSREIKTYEALPDSIFPIAKTWASLLETLGSPRVYWITLSEVVPHMHIHLFPRWPEDTLQGLPLFETREDPNQPLWTDPVREALLSWATQFQIELVEPPDIS